MSDEKNLPEVYTEQELDALEAHILAHFGEYKNVLHEIVSPDIHVDICLIEPTAERNYYTLVTMGMGAHRMNVPDELRNERDRSELLITLPPDWIINDNDEKWYWPIRWLKVLARLPGEQDTWLGYGHTVPNGEPFAENTELCGVMLTIPYFFDAEAYVCKLPDGSLVNFYQVLPLYENEINFKIKNNAEALEELFPDGFDMVLDIARKNVLSSKEITLPEIKEKLDRLKEIDKNFTVFGSDSHKYQMNPPLTEAEVSAFEAANNIRLPEEYRLYLTQIANGGAGPFYGLMALENNDKNKTDPSKSFPFTKDNSVILGELYGHWDDRYGDDDHEIIAGVYEDAHCGVKYLAHEGCGMYSVLVVNGPERGNVWYFDFANDAGALPLTNPKTGEPLGFFDWFDLWLDAALAHVETGAEELSGYGNFIGGKLNERMNSAVDNMESVNTDGSGEEISAPTPAPMNTEQFWRYIDYARTASGGWQNMLSKLVEALSALDAPDIFYWQWILDEYQTLADKRKLWAAAYIVMGGCSDDSFDYFRAWLIAQGKDVYLNALRDPDSLDDVPSCEGDTEFEALLSAAFEAWKAKTGAGDIELFYNELEKYPMPEKTADEILTEIRYAEDIDAEWSEDDSELQSLLPKLYKSFWDDFNDDDGEEQDPRIIAVREHLRLAEALNDQDKMAEAGQECQEALTLALEAGAERSLLFEIYYKIGINHLNRKNFPEAIAGLDRAIGQYPEHEPPELYKENEEFYKELYKQNDGDMRLYYWRGWAKSYANDMAGAEADFRKSLLMNETFRGDTFCSLGAQLNHAEKYKEAAVCAQKALDEYAKEPKTAFNMYKPYEAWFAKGLAMLGARDYKNSALNLAECMHLNHEYWNTYNLASCAVDCLGNASLAKELKEIYESKACPNPDNIRARLYKFLGVKLPKRTEDNMGQEIKKQGFFQRLFGKSQPEKQPPQSAQQQGANQPAKPAYDYSVLPEMAAILTNGNGQAISDTLLLASGVSAFVDAHRDWCNEMDYADFGVKPDERQPETLLIFGYWLCGYTATGDKSKDPQQFGAYIDWKEEIGDIKWNLDGADKNLGYGLDLEQIMFDDMEFTDKALQMIVDYLSNKGLVLVQLDTQSDCYHLFVLREKDYKKLAQLAGKVGFRFFHKFV